jgi:DNA-directed RNA polymerase I subunit RPA49
MTATTPGVLNSKGLRFNPYTKTRQDVERTATRNPGIVSSEMLLQSSEHQKMDFIGREGTGEDADSQLKHYIAVVDPERKTWQVIEARRVTIRGAVRSRKPEEDEEESEEEMVCPIYAICGAVG